VGIRQFSPALSELVDPLARIERIATGFGFTEGPLWDRREGRLLFTDLPGDVIRQWTSGAGTCEIRRPSGKANGLAHDANGRVLACEHVGRRVTRTEDDGRLVVIASEYAGKPLNSPNDVVVKSDGGVYFSDPPYGLMDYYGIARAQDLDVQGVYRVSPDGRVDLLADDFAAPNGLAFSIDESRLYVDDTERGHIRAFEVHEDGTLGSGCVFFDYRDAPPGAEGAPDGLKVDELGNLFATGPGGVWVIDPAGAPLGLIELPEAPSNLNWGDADRRTLFITAQASVYRVRTRVAGNRVAGA
jgi:sugar lactone lactonase YvrE